MSVKSIFDFRFPSQHREEGAKIAHAIGADMRALPGYLDHEILQDVQDAGHLMVNTHWRDGAAAAAVLDDYKNDQKVAAATRLIGAEPSGFVATVSL